MHSTTIQVLGLVLLIGLSQPAAAELLTNATIYDGSGNAPYTGSVRVEGGRIRTIGPNLKALPGEPVRSLAGFALAPGFIDMHSHADGALFAMPGAEAAVRQGITTVLVGQDGSSPYPLADFFARLQKFPVALNVAAMAGHTTLRERAMNGIFRQATTAEIRTMRRLLGREMDAGAFGLSTGLEYAGAYSATTAEVIAVAKVAAARGGFYITHVRDEGNAVFNAFDEVIAIGRGARIPVEISHIKLGTVPVWNQAATRIPKLFSEARRAGVDLTADVYPYTYWQSTLRVIVPDRDYFNPVKVEQAIADNGGAARIRFATYEPDPMLVGLSLAEVAQRWNLSPTDAFMRVVRETEPGPDRKAKGENVIVESMNEVDVRWFVASPNITFCTDGELAGSHPRGAGAFPRILGRYVREEGALTLALAVHKLTALPAKRLGLSGRGRIRPGAWADLVVFDPRQVRDLATIEAPRAAPEGIVAVMVNGFWVIDGGKPTGARPGQALRRGR